LVHIVYFFNFIFNNYFKN